MSEGNWIRSEIMAGLRGLQKIVVRARLADSMGIKPKNECWLWKGRATKDGYCHTRIRGLIMGVHQWSYLLHVGPLDPNLVVDHKCRTRNCANPFHLQQITNRENVLLGIGPTAQNAAKTHCLKGHPLIGSNLRLYKGKFRICRACHAALQRRIRAEKALARTQETTI